MSWGYWKSWPKDKSRVGQWLAHWLPGCRGQERAQRSLLARTPAVQNLNCFPKKKIKRSEAVQAPLRKKSALNVSGFWHNNELKLAKMASFSLKFGIQNLKQLSCDCFGEAWEEDQFNCDSKFKSIKTILPVLPQFTSSNFQDGNDWEFSLLVIGQSCKSWAHLHLKSTDGRCQTIWCSTTYLDKRFATIKKSWKSHSSLWLPFNGTTGLMEQSPVTMLQIPVTYQQGWVYLC